MAKLSIDDILSIIKIHIDLISPRRAFAYGIVGVLGIRIILPIEALAENMLKTIATFLVFSFQWWGTNYFNHIHDFESDKINSPERPLPSGKISSKNVLVFSGLWFTLSFMKRRGLLSLPMI